MILFERSSAYYKKHVQPGTLHAITLGLILIIFADTVIAQPLSASSAGSFNVKYYNSDNGLPQNTINGIEKDEYGYIWLATQGGLLRWSGLKFEETSELTDSAALLSNQRVRGFTRNKRGELLAVFNNWTTLRIAKQKLETCSDKSFVNFTWGTNGTFLKDTMAEHRHYYKQFYAESAPLFITKNNNAYRIQTDGIYTRVNNQIAALKFTSFSRLHLFLHDTLFYFEKKRTYYIKDSSFKPIASKWQFEDGTPVSNQYLNDAHSVHFQQQLPLIMYNRQLYRVTKKGNTFILSLIAEIGQHTLLCFYYDKEADQYLIGTSASGLIVIKKNRFSAVRNTSIKVLLDGRPEIFQESYAQTVTPDKDIVTFSGVSFHRNGQQFSSNLPILYSSVHDSQGNLWTAPLGKDVHKYDKALRLSKIYATSFYVKDILPLHNGKVWLAGFHKIASIDNRDSVVVEYSKPSTERNLIECIYPLDKNTLLVGTQDGLLQFDTRTKKASYHPLFAGKYIRSIVPAKSGKGLWILTYGQGLYYFHNQQLHALPSDKKQYLLHSNLIAEDDQGNLWIATNNGLFQTSIAAIIDYIQHRTERVFYYRWDKTQGFFSNEFNGGAKPGYIVHPDGFFSLPNMQGLVWFYPKELRPSFSKTPVFFKQVLLPDQQLKVKNGMSIPENAEQIKFIISTTHWENPANLRIEYKLGEKGKWHELEGDQIVITNPASGKNQLFVRKRVGLLSTDWIVNQLEFYVTPSWYETWYAIVLMLLIAATAVTIFIKWRERRLQQRKKDLELEVQERTKELHLYYDHMKTTSNVNKMLVSVIAHEIRNPLRFTSEILQELNNNWLRMKAEETSQMLFESNNALTSLRKYVNQILTWTHLREKTFVIQKNETQVYQMLQSITRYMAQTGSLNGNNITNTTSKTLTIQTDSTLLEILLHNIIDNACKYTLVGEIRLHAFVHNDIFVFECKDNGKGMSNYEVQLLQLKSKQATRITENSHSLGYLFIHQILDTLHGSLSIFSEQGIGTIIRIEIQLEQPEAEEI